MAGGKVINAIESPTGEKRKTPRKTNRKCGICGGPIGRHNDNKYCWAHTIAGFEKESEERDCRKFYSYRKHLKKMNRRNKEKKRDASIS